MGYSILPLAAIVIANQVQPTADGACSFQIVDEYYGDRDDEQAYYLIVEYMGEPSDEIIEKHIDDIRGIYSGYFNECTRIFIYYVDARIFYEKTDIENSADYEAILYPLPSP